MNSEFMIAINELVKEKGISKTAQREIAEILMREKRNQSHVSGEETVTYKKR